jgi:hypothetical protein
MNTKKCTSCSASVSLSAIHCEYCGVKLYNEELVAPKKLNRQIFTETYCSENISLVRRAVKMTTKRNSEKYNELKIHSSDSIDVRIAADTEDINVNILLDTYISSIDNKLYTIIKVSGLNILKYKNESVSFLQQFISEIKKNIEEEKNVKLTACFLYPIAYCLTKVNMINWETVRAFQKILYTHFNSKCKNVLPAVSDYYDNSVTKICEALEYISFFERENENNSLINQRFNILYSDQKEIINLFSRHELPIYDIEEIHSAIINYYSKQLENLKNEFNQGIYGDSSLHYYEVGIQDLKNLAKITNTIYSFPNPRSTLYIKYAIAILICFFVYYYFIN